MFNKLASFNTSSATSMASL
ncbi:hypothetical protein EYV94_11070 [Puteibacter caeruleilacunae]|nr:hypothetical protein EYV94_11070 [Puteibacter caeruleilacunae]